MARVELKRVSKSFGAMQVVHAIDLAIEDKEFVVLVGPSGCGKSTLLRMIAGLEEVSDGSLLFDGIEVNEVTPVDRNVAMVFQNYALYPHMDVRGNLAFGLRNAGMPTPEIERRIAEAAAILGLEPYLGRKPRQLSGGQRQRVAMGRAIVRHPSVFLFDEPLSNLDAKLRTQMRTEIKKLHQRVNTTVVYVTHDQTEAMTMADRIVVMREGRIEQQGRPTELFNNPVNLFVAGFIGTPAINLLRGRIAANDGPLAFVSHGGIHFPLESRNGLTAGQEVIAGVRPDDIRPASKDRMSGVILKGRVTTAEPMGAETYFLAQVAGDELMAKAIGRDPVEPGQEVTLRVDLRPLKLFDPASERTIY